MRAGELVWVGAGALGGVGRVALYFREDARAARARRPGRASSRRARRTTPSASACAPGAVLLHRPARRRHGVATEELQEALWDLVWAGEVTNDAFAPLRSPRLTPRRVVAARARRAGAARFSARRSGAQPQVQGRWSLTASLFGARRIRCARRRAQAELLLERYGIVTREQVLAEGIPGGFSSLYDSLAALETLGVARRGYFVEGLGGAQFALPGAVERLRAQRDDDDARRRRARRHRSRRSPTARR